MAAVRRLKAALSSWRTLMSGCRASGTGTGTAIAQQHPGDSLAGPLPRSRKYQPPVQLEERVRAALERVTGSPAAPGWQETQLGEGERFHLLCELAHELSHPVPNSRLHQMRRPADLLNFYQQPANSDPFAFQELAHSELPQNLRINWAYKESGGGDGMYPG